MTARADRAVELFDSGVGGPAVIARVLGCTRSCVSKYLAAAGRTVQRTTPPEIRFIRFLTFVERGFGGEPCVEWTGCRNSDGYGKFQLARRPVSAHRFAYEQYVGPIPEGLVIDHLCRNRACANPRHLEPVTQGENILRGGWGEHMRARAAKKWCKRGHPLSDDNVYRSRDGKRSCRTCAAERHRAARLARAS